MTDRTLNFYANPNFHVNNIIFMGGFLPASQVNDPQVVNNTQLLASNGNKIIMVLLVPVRGFIFTTLYPLLISLERIGSSRETTGSYNPPRNPKF